MRYAIEIHLIEVDDAGKAVKTLETMTVDDVTSDLKGAHDVARACRSALGDYFYEDLYEFEKITNRVTGELTYPDYAEELESETE